MSKATAMRYTFADLVAAAQAMEFVERMKADLAEFAAQHMTGDDGVIEFLEIATGDAFAVQPTEAIGYFRSKGLQTSFSYADMIGRANDQAFTVAKMMDVDLLKQVRDSLDSALANGTQFKDWADELLPTLQAAGWWGRKEVLDPLTGQTIVAQLGSPWRLETIFRTNMQTAYAAGAWQEIDQQADLAPFLMYDAVDDFRTREQHRLWDRKVLPVSSPWWKTHYPPNGWNCRCGVIQLDATEVKRLGLQVDQIPQDGTYKWKNPRTGEFETVPNGIDPGFAKNAGVSYLNDLKKLQADKQATLPPTLRAAAAEAKAQMDKVLADLAIAQRQTAAEVLKAEQAAAANLTALRARVAAQAKELDAQAQLDAITYDSDQFGRTTGDHIDRNRKGQNVASLREAAQSSGNETIFKGGLSLFDDVDRIVLSTAAEVKAAIEWMRSRGYSTWPDGRKLEEVIMTKAQNNARP